MPVIEDQGLDPPEPERQALKVVRQGVADGIRKEPPPWSARHVTNGRLATAAILVTLLNGILTLVVYWSVRTTAARDSQSLRQQITQQEEQRRLDANLYLKGVDGIHQDIDKLSGLIIIADKAAGQPAERPRQKGKQP